MGREAELIEAARGGNYPQVERILSTKPKRAGPFASLRRAQGGISSRDSRGYTALHYASLNGHKDVVQLLLSYEASCNSVDEAGSSPLHLAAWAGNGEVVRILLETGPSIPNVNLTNGDKETALHCASQYGHLDAVKLLLDAGADPNIKNIREETALDHAAQYGRIETVRLLLETNPEMVGKYTAYGSMLYTHTPLHLASRNGHRHVVEELLRVGLDINVRTSRGTALHEAALCGKVEVVRALLEQNINTNLRDQADRTVLDVMAELQTQRTREITKIILSHGNVHHIEPMSPYDNVSVGHALDPPSSSLTCPESPRPRAPSWHVREPRTAKSVEELDKRISSFSTTSGCSDCTTSTLQGAKSYESSFLSESEVTMTGTLTRGGDDTSISSGSSTNSLSPESAPRPASSVSQNTLTSNRQTEKPKVPAKPAHIRPGLKPVQIPNVDDKLGLKPRKPPRRNHSISPVRTNWESEGYDDSSSTCSRRMKGQQTVYSSKSGSKSFDELDDILSEKPKKQSSKKRGRRTMSSISGSDLIKAKERRNAERKRHEIPDSRHSCDEILEYSLHSQGHGTGSDTSNLSDCQRCVLNSISNRTLNEDHQQTAGKERFISQKQYKRKIRRDGSGGQTSGYSTLDIRTERKLTNGHDKKGSTKLVSKTTYKLKKLNGNTSDLDSAGEETYENSNGLELMEIPLSPTHYDQPPTPDHEPPTPWEAESAIHSVLTFLKNEYQPKIRTTATITEPWMMLSLDKSKWPDPHVSKTDQSTTTRPDRPSGRKLPEIPQNEIPSTLPSTPDSDDDIDTTSSNEVIMRPKNLGDTSIYQTIGGDSDSDDSSQNRMSRGSDKSQSLSILSPFDEQEEWSKISQIINSFGEDIGKQTENGKEANTPNNSPIYDYPTLKRREKLATTIEEWLRYINMDKYLTNFEGNGYDDVHFIGGGVMTKEDLNEIGIEDTKDCSVLIESLKDRENLFDFDTNGEPRKSLVNLKLEEWLKKLNLEQYFTNFHANLITDMDRIINIWDEELLSILEIDRVGHRKRILLSVAGPKGLRKRSGKVKVETIRKKSQEKDKIKVKESVSAPPVVEHAKKAQSPSEEILPKCSSISSYESRSRYSTTESDVSLSMPNSASNDTQRRYTSTSSTSEGSDKPPTPSKIKRTSVESGTLTLGRKKKRAPQPPTPSQTSPQLKQKEYGTIKKQEDQTVKSKTVQKPQNTEKSSQKPKETETVKSQQRPSFLFSCKVHYHGNTLVKEFNGIETTREAIEKVKTSKDIINKTGMPTTVYVSDTEVKITIFEGQEPIHQHQISNICCIVYDTDNMCMFGYITSDIDNMQRFSHVFSAESREKASEILTAICKGYKDNLKSPAKEKETNTVRKSSASKRLSQESENKDSRKVQTSQTTKEHRASRSDQLVTRMKNFFQGGESSGRSYSISHRKLSSQQTEARRKRGGSMDNLIDTMDSAENLTQDTKKKCSSIKNLSCIAPKSREEQKEVKITSV